MRFLVLNTDYPSFLGELYGRSPGLRECSFADQLAARNATYFGLADAYSEALRERGHWALDIHLNNHHLQGAWAKENGMPEASPRRRIQARLRRGVVPWIGRAEDPSWEVEVLRTQIEHLQPDVIFNHDINWRLPSELRTLAGPRLLVGQHAAPPLAFTDYSPYDLILSSWPPTLEQLRGSGVRAESLRLGFDPRVLQAVGSPP
ncbi:MAG TPA: hypothetical protein VF244_06365, partial [Acidimicrobiales bacterium]